MVTQQENGMVRVTMTLDPVDVKLLDALAAFEGSTRSAEVRSLLLQARPIMEQLVRTFTAVQSQRASLDRAMETATISELEAISPELDEISRRFLGTIAKLEGHAASRRDDGDDSAPASNTGATNS